MVHIVLQLVVHPSCALHFVRPVVGIEFCSGNSILVRGIAIVAVKLILPHQLVTLWSIVRWLLCRHLGNTDAFTCRTRHNRNGASADTRSRISRNSNCQRTCLGCRILSSDNNEFLIGVCIPLLTRGVHVDGVGTAFCRCFYAFLRQRDVYRWGQWVIVVAPTAATNDCGEREQECI